MKRTRILTNRNFPPETKGWEFIEKDDLGNFYWIAGEFYCGMNTEACFPVDEEFVREKFIEIGRVYNEN